MSSEDSDAGRELRQLTDARTLRALAHPVRIALYEELVLGGAMTATELGERIGETATTCSFHLRQLAKYGFVEEAGGGRGRARPWRRTSSGMSFSPGSDPEAQVASDMVVRMFRERQFARYETWRSTKASYAPEWRDAANDSEYLAYLTPDELKQMNTELNELLSRWAFLDNRLMDPSKRPPGSAPVETTLLSHPVSPPAPAPAPANDSRSTPEKGQPA